MTPTPTRYRNRRLFDIEADPGQTTDLAVAHPEVLAQLRVQLIEINASIMVDGTD